MVLTSLIGKIHLPPPKQVPMDGSIVINRDGCVLKCALCCVELPWVSLVLLVLLKRFEVKEIYSCVGT